MKNVLFVTANCQYSPPRVSLLARRAMWSQRAMFARHSEQSYSLRRALCHRRHVLPATASNMVTERVLCPPRRATHLGGELPQFQFFCFAFCVISTYFCFELTLGINMKVFKGFISYPMAPN